MHSPASARTRCSPAGASGCARSSSTSLCGAEGVVEGSPRAYSGVAQGVTEGVVEGDLRGSPGGITRGSLDGRTSGAISATVTAWMSYDSDAELPPQGLMLGASVRTI
eukprot:200918-Prorocentrum_minimum.AAC.1